MKIKELINEMEYEILAGSEETEITTLVYDSRKVEKGSVFVCISGSVRDAHEFIPDVAAKGAAAIVVEKDVTPIDGITYIKVEDSRLALACMSAAYFGHPAKKLKTIGITGTKGKTTTTYMVRSILESAGIKTGLIGTIESIVGSERIPSANTTPESYRVQELFAKMVDAGLDAVVMEVSSQALMLHRVCLISACLPILNRIISEKMSTRILQIICTARVFCSSSAGMEFLMGTASICRAFYRDIPVRLRRLGMEQKMI